MLKDLSLAADAPWRERYRAPVIAWSNIATQNPQHGLVCTNRDGIYQLYAWEVATGTLRRVTDAAAGLINGYISADGNWIYYLHDARGAGSEIGHYYRVPFAGGTPEDFTPQLPEYASFYFAETVTGNHFGFMAANQTGFHIYVVDHASGEALLHYESGALSVGPNLSYAGEIAVIATTEKSGSTDYSIEAYDVVTATKLGELWDGFGTSIQPVGFIPRAGDMRYLATTNKSGYARPLIWNPRTGERLDIALPELSGEVYPQDWTEDGQYLLLMQLHQAQYQLYLYDVPAQKLITLNHPAGTYSAAYFSHRHTIFACLQDSTNPARQVELELLTGELKQTLLMAGTPPAGRRWQSVTYPSSDGTPIQAWLVTPEGAGPFPTIVHTHGGPTAVMTETYAPGCQAWVDHGFAWFSINYRGSVTFGKDFEKAILGNLGDLEVEDIAAGVQWLIANNIAMPDSILKTGGSYGGYLTLQSLGKKPDLWAGGMALVAIGDWRLMYEDQAETLRGYQRALFGGTPDEKPEAITKSSPITYAQNVKAPLFVIQGKNDTRCPARQMQAYESKLTEMGKSIYIEWFDAGHGSKAMEQQIEQQEMMLRFAYRVLG